jgi:hypothetical protein
MLSRQRAEGALRLRSEAARPGKPRFLLAGHEVMSDEIAAGNFI